MKPVFAFILLIFTFCFAGAQDKPEGLFINSKAPEIKGKDQNGNPVSLKEMRKKGNVVVVFYRGYWCPYCNKELTRLQDSLQFIKDKGAQLIAVTLEGAEGVAKTVEKTKASFPIVTDADMKIAKGYGVSFQVDEKTTARYKSFGTDLLQNNNQKDQAYLPVPAVYVVNKDGAVTFRYFDADYKNRISVKELLKQL